MAYFPMFVDITDKKCLVVGGGKVALRKVQVLMDFGADVLVVADRICDDINKLCDEKQEVKIQCIGNSDKKNENLETIEIKRFRGSLSLLEKKFEDSDIKGKLLVVAATSDDELNARISSLCRAAKIPVNVVDDKEKCSFIFPSYIKEKNLVGAFSSGGNSPVLATYMKNKMSDVLTSQMGELNETFGKLRPKIIKKFPEEKDRKAFFGRIIELAGKEGRVPNDSEIEEMLK